MRFQALSAALAAAGLLVACGGGGGSSEPAPTTGDPSAVQVELTGTAAKGLMADALVTAHAVRADGSVDPGALASARTDAQGKYTLDFTGVKDQPYVIKVTAEAGTTHLDEATGQSQPLPAGFTMRALIVPEATGTVTTSASVTPFSEMAVSAAAKATGGITTTSAAQATTAVTQLLGFNPVTVPAATVGTAATPDQQKLALMLTAVSKLAADDALGCNSGTDGEKTQCVVTTLASAASGDSIKLQTAAGVDVSGALLSAVQAVVADPQLSGPLPPTLVAAISTNLGCSGDACSATNSGGGAVDPVATGISSAKLLFASLKADFTSMFSKGGVTSLATGAANVQAWKFQQAMTNVQVPAETLMKDAAALLIGVELYNTYKAGLTNDVSRGRAPGTVSGPDTPFVDNFSGVGCSLYQDAATTVVATAPSNARYVGCRASYYVDSTVANGVTTTTEWRHSFTLTPSAAGDSFGYASRARKRTSTCVTGSPCTVDTANLQGPYEGTVTVRNAGARIEAFHIAGKLPGAFEMGATALVNAYHEWTVDGERTAGQGGADSTTFGATVRGYDAQDVLLGTLEVGSGRLDETVAAYDDAGNPVKPGSATATSATTDGILSGGTLQLRWTTAAAQFEGALSVGDAVWDQTGLSLAPTRASLSGALRTIEAGQTTEFLSGTLEAKLLGYEAHRTWEPKSASNTYTRDFRFVGKVTAPNRPLLEVTMAVARQAHLDGPTAGTLQYRSLVNGVPRTVVNLAASRNASNQWVLPFNEAATGLSATYVDGADAADLMAGSNRIGVISRSGYGVTFSTGEFMSLDFGL